MSKRKILITGKGSYVGTNFIKWLEQWPDQYEVVELSVRGTEWKEHDFSIYDVVLHVAGIAHVSTDPSMEQQYYKVNRDLAIEVAEKAKEEHVKQFIFTSSIIVYGDSSHINKKRIIDNNTKPQPSNFYGNSKLQAEEGISLLESDDFKVVIIRPPMIYGKGSKGNYPKLASYARKLPIFPDIDNERSMLHIDNLCEFIRLMIDNNENGVYFPQNNEYVKTTEMVRLISEIHQKNVKLTRVFNPLIKFMGNFVGTVNKAFGNLVYEQGMSEYKENYRVWDLQDSIGVTEK
ncbi:NAD-dependent epimerase [Paenibacillus odorifer]|jgi:nucleoside-diphosphate-sugar epimerase|uniref:NAD-dependent epimerase n=1 Tax=Paenibacillus odorifer TaxID=189426 RepID=A0ABX3GF57_9BACL|nr:NAD-dependent epimerase/dehydratase family protein [Paenibacillus odorifer]OMC73881.1 NAD-dependent epimerase [Paenibacillus odorifer]OMD11766.1 NAD-dependent epimerase [Paenibacillus odorifer]